MGFRLWEDPGLKDLKKPKVSCRLGPGWIGSHNTKLASLMGTSSFLHSSLGRFMNLLRDSMGFQSFEMENKSATADGNS